MLEGEEQIAAPRNPFAHLAPYTSSAIQSSGDTTVGPVVSAR
jgi:hypothetical protein